jgi:LmbE family N-acetylglucosaminyl deacetylase
MFGQRILILVPHPDDEVVACCATIKRAQTKGSTIFSLYLTHGCLDYETLWPWQRKNYTAYVGRRRSEAETVADFLHITPVGWCSRPARHLWRELSSAYKEIQIVISDHNIDQIWVPAYEGGNADHDGTNALGSVLARQVSVLEFAEYNLFQGQAHSHVFPYTDGTEQVIALTLVEQQRKREALAHYKSEKLNLNYVDVQQECYRPLTAYDYTAPPHPGTLWYTRFQWVPFRHPRVDFTRPEEVSAAIKEFDSNPRR